MNMNKENTCFSKLDKLFETLSNLIPLTQTLKVKMEIARPYPQLLSLMTIRLKSLRWIEKMRNS